MEENAQLKWHPSQVGRDEVNGLSIDQLWEVFSWCTRSSNPSGYLAEVEQATCKELAARGIKAKRTFNSFRMGSIITNPAFLFWLEGSTEIYGDSRADGLRDRTEWITMQNNGVTFGDIPHFMASHPTTLKALCYNDRNQPQGGWKIPYNMQPVEITPDELQAAHQWVSARC